jgi:hypothetical protein
MAIGASLSHQFETSNAMGKQRRVCTAGELEVDPFSGEPAMDRFFASPSPLEGRRRSSISRASSPCAAAAISSSQVSPRCAT